MTDWRTHTPQYDGHAPDDWQEGMEIEVCSRHKQESGCFWYSRPFGPRWYDCFEYRYRPLQDATHEPDLLAQCLALPQADRDALIEALQKPQEPETDWAEDVWDTAYKAFFTANPNCLSDEAAFEVIRSMCRPKEDLQELTEAAKSARVLIGARNDSLSEAARASNINEAWHILDKAIAKATK